MADTDIRRRQTVPSRRKDGLAIQGQFNFPCTRNTNKHDLSSMGKSREINLKRSDSYRQATKTFPVGDNLSINVDSAGIHDGHNENKYNTLPVNSKVHLTSGQNKAHTMNGFNTGRGEIHRNELQKSGNLPSPDTDEDQTSAPVSQVLKTKRWFRKGKQPQISTKKESDDDKRQNDKKRSIMFSIRRPKVSDKDNTERTKDGRKIFHERSSYTEQHPTGENGMSTRTEMLQNVDIKSKNGGSHSTRTETYNKEVTEETGMSSSKQGPFHFISKFTRSLRKKKKGNSKQSIKEHSVPKEASLKDAAPCPQQPLQSDAITDIFEVLIEPSSSINRASARVLPKKADRSKLHLHGLKKARPTEPEKGIVHESSSCSVAERQFINAYNCGIHETDEIHEQGEEVLTPTVDIDGPAFDSTDGVDDQEQEHDEANAGAEFSQADDTERNRRITDVAHRLQQIGDNIKNRRESSQSSSEPEGGSNHESLIEYLRQLGDNVDSRFFQQRVPSLTSVIIPVIHNMIKAKTYDRFQRVIMQELQDTVGWEQVAWYTYLTKSAILLVSHGLQVGSQLRQMARQYFTDNIRPFIEQQPNGWESVTEERGRELD